MQPGISAPRTACQWLTTLPPPAFPGLAPPALVGQARQLSPHLTLLSTRCACFACRGRAGGGHARRDCCGDLQRVPPVQRRSRHLRRRAQGVAGQGDGRQPLTGGLAGPLAPFPHCACLPAACPQGQLVAPALSSRCTYPPACLSRQRGRGWRSGAVTPAGSTPHALGAAACLARFECLGFASATESRSRSLGDGHVALQGCCQVGGLCLGGECARWTGCSWLRVLASFHPKRRFVLLLACSSLVLIAFLRRASSLAGVRS